MIQSRKDTPPYPTHQRSTAYRCQRARTLHQHRNALCITRNMNVIIPPQPTPPHPTHQRSTAYRCQRARTLHQHRNALCITRNMNVIIPPHPTPPHETMIYVVKNAQKHAVPMGKAHKKVRVYRSTEPPTNIVGLTFYEIYYIRIIPMYPHEIGSWLV